MENSKDYRFIAFIDELTPAQKEILAKMIRKRGVDCNCRIKFKKSFNMSKDTIAKAKARLTELNIIKKTKKAFTFHINAIKDWNIQIKDKPEHFRILFDATPEYMQRSGLTRTEYLVYSRIYGSTSAEYYWEVRKKVETIAKEINVAKKVTREAAKTLERYNLVLRERSRYDTSRHRPYKYIITTANLWSQEFVDTFPEEVKPQIAKDLVNNLSIAYNCSKSVVMEAIQTYCKELQEGKKPTLKLPLTTNKQMVEKRSDSSHFFSDGGDNAHEKKGLIYAVSIENTIILCLSGIWNNKLFPMPFESHFHLSRSARKKKLSRKLVDQRLSKKKLLEPKDINKPLEPKDINKPLEPKDTDIAAPKEKSLRDRLKGATDREAEKFRKKTEVKPMRYTKVALKLWSDYCAESPRLYVQFKADQENKTYREIVDSLNKFFRGTLFARGKVVLPARFKPFEQKFTFKEFEIFMRRLDIQMKDPNVGFTPFGNKKANLKEFLLGNKRTGAPSKLLSCCWYEPSVLNIKHVADVERMKELYRKHFEENHQFTHKDLEAFDKCAEWASPFSDSLSTVFKHSNIDLYYSVVSVVKKVADSSADPLIFAKPFVERMTRKLIYDLGYRIE